MCRQIVEKMDLIGLDFLWKICMNVPDFSIAESAISLLLHVSYISLSSRYGRVSSGVFGWILNYENFLSFVYHRTMCVLQNTVCAIIIVLLVGGGARWLSGTVPDFAIARSRVRIPPAAAVHQRQLSVPSLWGRLMSTSESWGVNGHNTRCTIPVSVVLQLRLVSG